MAQVVGMLGGLAGAPTEVVVPAENAIANTAHVVTTRPEASAPNAVSLAGLGDGILAQAVVGGEAVPEIAQPGTDYYAPGGTDIPIADGGTGASTAADARTNLGIGSAALIAEGDLIHKDGSVVFTADQSMDSHKLTDLTDPTSAQDAATKAYVDAVAAGLIVKDSVRAATTAQITLSGAQTIDGVAVIATNRVLVKNQTLPAENGIYVAAAGAWARATDMDAGSEAVSAFTFVEEGGQASTGWVQTTPAVITLDTTELHWSQFSRAGDFTAGDGLALAGNVFSVNVDGSTLVIVADTLQVKNGGIGTAQLAPSGVIPGTYGDSLHIPVLQIDSTGRVIGVVLATVSVSGAPASNQYVVTRAPTGLPNARNLGLLATGLLMNTVVAGQAVLSKALEGTDYYQPGQTDVRVVDGGTGASDAATARTNLGLGTVAVLASDTDGTLAANSDVRIATQKAVVTYVAAQVGAAVTGLLDFKGATDASGNPNYPVALKGDAYVVSVAGKVGGASGSAVDVGDVYFAIADNAGGTQAAVGASWAILEHNLAGALLTANNLSELAGTAATARSNIGAFYDNVSATDKVLGRATAGAGAVEEIACTAAGRALLDDTDAAAQRTTLGILESFVIACSDETTAITTGAAKVTFRMPYAFTVTAVRASLTTASSSGNPAIDINEGGVSILSTTITIDANELTSTTAATPAVISDSALADDAEITIDIDTAGTGAKGLKVYIIGRQT